MRMIMKNIIRLHFVVLVLLSLPAKAQIVKENSRFIPLTAGEFMEKFIDSSLDKPEFRAPEKHTVIHMYAEWCAPCKAAQTFLENYAKAHPDYDYYVFDVYPIMGRDESVSEDERSAREGIIKWFGGKVPTILLGRIGDDKKWVCHLGIGEEARLIKDLDEFFLVDDTPK